MPGEDEHCQDISHDMLVKQVIQEELSGEKSMDEGDDTSPPHTFLEEIFLNFCTREKARCSRRDLSGPLHTEICNLQKSIRYKSRGPRRQFTLIEMMERDYS